MSERRSELRMFNPLASKRGPSVTDQIKDFILSNNLHPGDLMPTEAAISTELGVSRSSVREAMRTLVALDIVEVRHGYGTYVGDISLAPLVEGLVFRGVMSPENNFAALREVVEIREVLDLAMAERVVTSFMGEADSELHDLVMAMEDLAERNESFAEADNAFHQRILNRLDNQLVGQLSTAFWEVHTVVYPLLGLPPAADISETARAHGLMLEAAENGDVEAYKEAVILHYQPLRRSIDKALAAPST